MVFKIAYLLIYRPLGEKGNFVKLSFLVKYLRLIMIDFLMIRILDNSSLAAIQNFK